MPIDFDYSQVIFLLDCILKNNEKKKTKRFTYFKKPDWMKELSLASNNTIGSELRQIDQPFVFEILEVFRVDGNNELIFKPKYKLI